MTVFKNKLFVLLFVTLTVAVFGWQWYNNRSDELTKEQLIRKIDDGYSRQFCNVIFPHIADCVTLASTGCPDLVHQSLEPCIADLMSSAPARVGVEQAREMYSKVAPCFELNIRNEMQVKYQKPTQECRQKLS